MFIKCPLLIKIRSRIRINLTAASYINRLKFEKKGRMNVRDIHLLNNFTLRTVGFCSSASSMSSSSSSAELAAALAY